MNEMHEDPLARLAAPPIFVVGVHRSGTTWVYDMLTAHPEVAGVFESGLFSFDLGVAPLFHPSHWYRDPDRLEHDTSFFGASFRLNQLLDREELVEEVLAMSSGWLARALTPDDRYLVEKTPQHYATMPLIAELFPGAAFVHVIRDGRDVTVSRAAAQSWARQTERQWSLGAEAAHWASAIREARALAEERSLRYLEVRYEALHRSGREELRSIFDFCGIPANDQLVRRICERTKLASGGGDEGAFRRRGVVGEWRERWGLLDRIRFDRAAGEMLVQLGYERGRAWWLPGRGAHS
jgi:hypothetical protein